MHAFPRRVKKIRRGIIIIENEVEADIILVLKDVRVLPENNYHMK